MLGFLPALISSVLSALQSSTVRSKFSDGKKEYIYGEWVSEAGDEILYQVSEKSFYDIFERIYKAKSRKEEDRILAEKDKIPCTEPDED